MRALLAPENGILRDTRKTRQSASITRLNGRRVEARPPATGHRRRIFENMANTTSAKKATRKIARRTIINKSRRTQMRGCGPHRRRGDQERRPRCGAEGDGARRAGTDAGSAAQHHSQEQCEPEGLAAGASDRQAREMRLIEKYIRQKPGRAGLFLLMPVASRPPSSANPCAIMRCSAYFYGRCASCDAGPDNQGCDDFCALR